MGLLRSMPIASNFCFGRTFGVFGPQCFFGPKLTTLVNPVCQDHKVPEEGKYVAFTPIPYSPSHVCVLCGSHGSLDWLEATVNVGHFAAFCPLWPLGVAG